MAHARGTILLCLKLHIATSDIPEVSTKKCLSCRYCMVSVEISVHSGRAYPNSFAKFCCVWNSVSYNTDHLNVEMFTTICVTLVVG